MRIIARTDPGKVRSSNQDSYAAGEFRNGVAWAVVCDGMGGSVGGNIASSTAVRSISERITTAYRENMSSSSIRNLLVTAITIIAYLIGSFFEFGQGFFGTLRAAGESGHGMTMAFLTMSMCEIFHSFNLRSQRKSVFSLKGQNKILWAAMLGSLVLTTALLEVPFLANAFGFQMISWTEYAISIGLAILVIPIVELVKLIQRKIAK